MYKRLWDNYFLKMRILVYLQLGLVLYSGLTAYTIWQRNFALGLLMLISAVGAIISIYLVIKSAAVSFQLEKKMQELDY